MIETGESNSLMCLVFIFILSKISKCICVWSSCLETWTPTLASYAPQAFILVECLVKLDIDLITPYGIIVDSILPTPIYIMNMVSSKHLLPKIRHNLYLYKKHTFKNTKVEPVHTSIWGSKVCLDPLHQSWGSKVIRIKGIFICPLFSIYFKTTL